MIETYLSAILVCEDSSKSPACNFEFMSQIVTDNLATIRTGVMQWSRVRKIRLHRDHIGILLGWCWTVFWSALLDNCGKFKWGKCAQVHLPSNGADINSFCICMKECFHDGWGWRISGKSFFFNSFSCPTCDGLVQHKYIGRLSHGILARGKEERTLCLPALYCSMCEGPWP